MWIAGRRNARKSVLRGFVKWFENNPCDGSPFAGAARSGKLAANRGYEPQAATPSAVNIKAASRAAAGTVVAQAATIVMM
jgi:hypothetical protein